MRVSYVAMVLWAFVGPLSGQDEPAAAANPLAQLKDQVKSVLSQAQVPFTEDQEKSIVLMMEDRRKASEDLFGGLMNFTSGPTQGQDSDRLRSAIEWMRNEFLARLQDYLDPQQTTAWSRYLEAAEGGAANSSGGRARPQQQSQTQYVRINNNAFTSEDGGYRNSGGGRRGVAREVTEVIPRGGVGAWHGNAQFLLKDDGLNAGRRFVRNKPPYQERQTSFNVSGPLLPGRLTTSLDFNQSEAENVDTIRATLPDSIFALGITKPTTTRSLAAGNTLQLSDSTSLSFNGGYSTSVRKNQGVGGFVMPDRAFNSNQKMWNFEVKQFSALSARNLYETRFNLSGNHDETTPGSQGLQINVTDAFSAGGAQNHVENTGRTYEFSNLYSRLGETLTVKAGLSGIYQRNSSISENNFTGTFTFSGLDAYRQGRPINYRVGRGNPSLEFNQWEMAFFEQNDIKLTPRFTLMAGLRYEFQTNMSDHNNIAPRIGFAYGIGRATVIRGGAGIFHQRMPFNVLENQIRRNGEWQYEIVVDSPSFPDPFQAGTVRNTRPSVRVTDPNLVTPYSIVTGISVERTFFSNLFVSVSYDRNREVHRPRPRNINAPMDITSPVPASCKAGQSAATCVRPFPDRGNIINLESSASESAQAWRFNVRQRFSIFTVTANYNNAWSWLDATPASNYGNASTIGGFGPDGLNADNYDLRSDWTLIFTPRHQVTTTVNAQLPFGIFLTNSMNARIGQRYTILTGKDDNQDTSVNDRPPGVVRNGAHGPASVVFNFNISKAFFFGAPQQANSARTNVNVFVNMTNAFNRPNYGPPSGVMTSPNFGRSTTAGDPREIEAGIRFQF